MVEKLEEISAELEDDMKDTEWTGKTVTLKFKTDAFQGESPLVTGLTFGG